MSYDLYFYKKKGNILTEQSVSDYLTKTLPFNISDYSRQWNYENSETGVYFLIDWNEPNTDKEDIEIWDSFDEFEYLNFSLSINFFRPRYFGLEIFSIVEKIIEALDLYILNSQDEIDAENPRRFEKGYFQDQWIKHNDQVSITHFQELNFKFMPPEKSNAMWWFQLHRTELQDSLVEDIFVPGFFVINNKEDNKLYTACVWPQHIPIILPVVDYVIVQKEYKRLFKTVKESGLVSYDVILKELGNYFEDFDHAIPNLKVLKQYNADKMKDKFNSLKTYKTVEEFGSGVGKDGFVNVQPNQ
ncbi:MAG: hypothetical protein JWQ66_3149 [Mucilaginibacter sp.]|nr:hypothetical protein [Mucilaginibacter sp.]